MQDKTKDYYTVKEVAERLRVSPRTVTRAINAGKLRAIRPFGRAFLVPRDAFEELETLR